MRLKKSPAKMPPRVGAVIVKNGKLISKSYKNKDGKNIHAEHSAISEGMSAGADLKGATVYTTLEPCSNLGGNKTPCAELLIKARIGTVYIGSYDLNPTIYRKGWRALVAAGIEVKDFSVSTRALSKDLNQVFNGYFRHGIGMHGSAKFDYSQNGGRFQVFFDESMRRGRVTTWTARSEDSVYAYDGRPGNLALAKYATSFDQIDDPDALDYESHSEPVKIGEIVVFKDDYAHVLIRIKNVEAGPERGHINTALHIEWEVRPKP